MTLLVVTYKSCKANILLDDDIISIQYIGSNEQGKGHARKLIEKIESLAKNNKVKEIWVPTVVSEKLSILLKHMQYQYVNFGIHPMMPNREDVMGYQKTLEIEGKTI